MTCNDVIKLNDKESAIFSCHQSLKKWGPRRGDWYATCVLLLNTFFGFFLNEEKKQKKRCIGKDRPSVEDTTCCLSTGGAACVRDDVRGRDLHRTHHARPEAGTGSTAATPTTTHKRLSTSVQSKMNQKGHKGGTYRHQHAGSKR